MAQGGPHAQLDPTLRRLDETLSAMDGQASASTPWSQRPLLLLGGVVALGYLLGASLGSRTRRRPPARWLNDTIHGYGRPLTTRDVAHRHSGAVER